MFGGSFGVECSFFWCKSVKCSFFWCKKVLVWVRLLQEGLSSLGRHEAAFSLTVRREGARYVPSLLKTPCRSLQAVRTRQGFADPLARKPFAETTSAEQGHNSCSSLCFMGLGLLLVYAWHTKVLVVLSGHFSAPMHPSSRAWLLLDLLKQRTGPSGPPWMSLNPPGPPAGAAGEHSGYLAAAFGARAVVSCSEQSPRSRPDPAQQPVAILRCPGSLTEE